MQGRSCFESSVEYYVVTPVLMRNKSEYLLKKQKRKNSDPDNDINQIRLGNSKYQS